MLCARDRYDHRPECRYSPSRRHVAIHVRLGDRADVHGGVQDYFELLEEFMDLVALAFSDQGHDPPMFHVFSETAFDCPSPGEGFFEEFPLWPIEEDEVRTRGGHHYESGLSPKGWSHPSVLSAQ